MSNFINLLDIIYPIGSFYFSSINNSPSNIIGGIWEKIEGRFLLAESNDFTINSTGGEKTHTLSIGKLAQHHHYAGKSAWLYYRSKGAAGCAYPENPGGSGSTWGICSDPTISSYLIGMAEEGSNQPHNNMPPYQVIYMWHRVA